MYNCHFLFLLVLHQFLATIHLFIYIRTRKNGDFVEIEIPATEQSSLWIYPLRKPKKYRKEYQLLHFFRIFVPHCAPLVLEKSIVGALCWCLRTYNNHISNSINN